MNVKKMFALVIAFVAPVSFAGLVVEVPVMIDTEAMTASGNMKTARFSANEQEQIGCGVRANDFSGTIREWAFCQASIDEATSAFCTTDNPELVERVRNINDYSFVIFAWDEEGVCHHMGFSTQSQYIPQFLDKKAK